jgi:hypothetical protein
MLYAMWHASGELEGHGQQGEYSTTRSKLNPDAHSFFLAALDQIHAHAKGQLSSCNCIARESLDDQSLMVRPDLLGIVVVLCDMLVLSKDFVNCRSNPRHPA